MDTIMETDRELAAFIDRLREDPNPVILVTFGDHMPWMGDSNAFYDEMGMNIDPGEEEGFYNHYKESGFYPEWSSPGHRDCMIGNNSASVVADAFVKGVTPADAEAMYEGLLHGANALHPTVPASGRVAFEEYNTMGYVPSDVAGQSAARTLEYAYDDWCIYQMGRKLGRPQSRDRRI